MKFVKLMSILLAVLMVAGSLVIVASADNSESNNSEPAYSKKTGNGVSLMMPDASNEGQYLYREGKYIDSTGKVQVVESPEEKLALMDYRYGTESYELYVDAYSGEVAIRSKVTGETLFTNPYNIGSSKANDDENSTKDELLSQIIVNYSDIKEDSAGTLNSYTWAALRNQINVKNIKGGIRVEYAIGREENRSLLPHLIEATAMEEIFNTIETNLEAAIAAGSVSRPEDERHNLIQFKAYYEKYSMADTYDANGKRNEEIYKKYCDQFPILQKFEEKAASDPSYANMAIYAINEAGLGDQVVKKLESMIKEYYPEYTFEMLEEAHAFVEYEAKVESYPLFKLALEYTIDENTGLVVRLPANGIRFDETLYRLDSIDILPYMGAGMNPNEGYTFFPDGSGTLFDFEEIAVGGQREKVTAKIYGQDYAYHELSGMYEEVIRYPVFGIYENQKLTREVDDGNGGTKTEEYTKKRGFVAIIEEGESLMQLATYHGGITSEYNTIIMSAMPRPTDSYNMAEAISVGSNTEWTVVSSRKYTGSYTVRYIMLTDKETDTEKGIFETSYVGMAKAYRNYLEKNGSLTRLTAEDVKADIPLYIETFGALQTTERFLSIPIKVMTPLTTFEDITTMYSDLKNQGITNLNFIMTGYTKGGLTGERVPYKLKWEKAVSKEMDFEELNEYARQNDFGVFPDFDFVFSSNDKWFDGLSLKKHAAKTIDDRYTSKREYSATKHTYVSYYELALSSAYFSHFYEKFIPKYAEYNPVGISVSTLGSYLNSDFDEDEPYHRADSQQYTINAFEYINSQLPNAEIMTSGGNAYCWKYVDHITDVALDSSRFSISSASVPFLGIVLHGYVEIAGTPVNMEGNLDYAFLKAIESGAALKFILSYQNTDELKEYETLSRYYSVDYSIWFDEGEGDLVTMYKELNEVLKGVQTSIIVGHEFIDGVRVPDADEILTDAYKAVEDAVEYEIALKHATNDTERNAIYEARQLIVKGSEAIKNATDPSIAGGLAAKLEALKSIYNGTTGEYATLLKEANDALEYYKAAQQFHAIYSDKCDVSTVYKVEAALAAYEAYKAASPSDANYAELKAALDKQIEIVGGQYLEAVIEEKEALDALNADKNNETLKKAYEAKVAARKALLAGKFPTATELVNAMNALESYKQAWIEASKGTDATATENAKKAFEDKVVEIYEPLYSAGVVYEITYEGTRAGGSRGYRDYAGTIYKEKTAALDESLNKLYAESRSLMDELEVFRATYSVEKIEAALKILEEKGAYTEAERAKLADIVNDLKVYLAGSASSRFTEIMTYDVNGKATDAYEQYMKLYELTDAAGVQVNLGDIADYEISGLKASTFFKCIEYSWSSKIKDKVSTEVTKPTPDTRKYNSDTNMIVHETFDNGTELILNFNDYRVIVEIGGISYTIDAFGYVILKRPNA